MSTLHHASATGVPALGGPATSGWTGDLPVNPFVALRVAFGMLLGENDFETLMGNPRGKQMLHSAWLHGPGVVWGYRVRRDGFALDVDRGLALDALGREVWLQATSNVDVPAWMKRPENKPVYPDTEPTHCVEAHIVAEYRSCPTAPVPTLADPCDVTRQHDDWSRVVETAKVELRMGRCPLPRPTPYPRVRALFGLHHIEGEAPTNEVQEALRYVGEAPPEERAEVLLEQFRLLSALDVMDLGPWVTKEADPTPFPVPEPYDAVVLAGVKVFVRRRDDYDDVERVEVDPGCRVALLPTTTIQELLCGLAPGLVPVAEPGYEEQEGYEEPEDEDAGGPRVDPESMEWTEDGRCLNFNMTAAVHPRSLRVSVEMSSLSAQGWDTEDVDRVTYEPGPPHRVSVHLEEPPKHERIRLIVRGTGARPVFGAAPAVPLAGLVGGPPGTVNDGHDAVLMLDNPTYGRAEG